MALPMWKSLAKTHVSTTSVCRRQKAITATGGCFPQQVTPAAMCFVMRQNQYATWLVTLNAGGNKFHLGGHVIMHIPDVLKAMDYAPAATFVATHLEGVNHNQVTRVALREEVMKCGKADRIHIPEDGEIVEL